jgi:hypothetical protein
MSNFHVSCTIACRVPAEQLADCKHAHVLQFIFSRVCRILSSLVCRLMFIKNVAGPEFESYANCMEKSDRSLSLAVSWCSPMFCRSSNRAADCRKEQAAYQAKFDSSPATH